MNCFIKKEKEKEKEKGGTKNREKRKFEGNGRESKMALFIVAFSNRQEEGMSKKDCFGLSILEMESSGIFSNAHK